VYHANLTEQAKTRLERIRMALSLPYCQYFHGFLVPGFRPTFQFVVQSQRRISFRWNKFSVLYFIQVGDRKIEKIGSYVSETYPNDLNDHFWTLPNVIGFKVKSITNE
jgi:hypothetical protein